MYQYSFTTTRNGLKSDIHARTHRSNAEKKEKQSENDCRKKKNLWIPLTAASSIYSKIKIATNSKRPWT